MAARASTVRKSIKRSKAPRKKTVRSVKTTSKPKTGTRRATKKSTAKSTGKAASTKIKPVKDKQTSAQIIAHIAEATGIDKKSVKAVFSEMRDVAESHIMRRGSGECPIPELGIKIRRHEKPARKARMGRNPATGEPVKIAAKPKQLVVKVQALKKLKEILA